ncbi:MAG: putative pit accessory protein [Lentisphaerae bacterium ADurb.Bin242]|nr:MAG: putative pit accessory protein [Lentisphaerae bacterium ADurb.Bin242]
MKFSILDLLLPRETKFFDLLDQLSDYVYNSCFTFRDLVVQIETLSEDERKKRFFTIKDFEHRGDQMEMTIIEELSRCFITPLDREDIHTLAVNLERPLDELKDLIRKIEIYQIHKLPINVCQFCDIIVSLAKLQQDIVCDLHTRQKVRKKVEQMHKLENQADELFNISMAELFCRQDAVLTVEMVQLKEIYESLEAAVNGLDDIGKLVRGIKIKNG